MLHILFPESHIRVYTYVVSHFAQKQLELWIKLWVFAIMNTIVYSS